MPQPALRLIETGVVVQLEPNRFEDAWASIPSTMKTRSDSRAKVRKVWDMHAKRCGGQDLLLGALRAYVKGDKDLPKSGGPGLQVWLRAEKYDHWIPCATQTAADGSRMPSFPEPYRATLVACLGEPFVLSYLDPCTFHEDGYITPKTSYAEGKLREKGRELKGAGLKGIRPKV